MKLNQNIPEKNCVLYVYVNDTFSIQNPSANIEFCENIVDYLQT